MIIIMAGGKSSRMGKEKPVLKLMGKELIMWVYEKAKKVDETYVAISKNTERTFEFCRKNKIPIIKTFGNSYVSDVIYLLREYGPFISIASDTPFVKSEDIIAIMNDFKVKKTSITGVVPSRIVPIEFRKNEGYILVGLNSVAESGDDTFVFDNPYLGVNINTPTDLKNAEKLARRLNS